MRDINRIEPIMAKITALWKLYPDYRYGQLMSRVFGEMNKEYGIKDMFFPEEEKWSKVLDIMIKQQRDFLEERAKRYPSKDKCQEESQTVMDSIVEKLPQD